MNWTGGTRVRHNRPSSDTTRLQKRYFARVRAAQNPTLGFSHASSSSVLGDGNTATTYGKRKKKPAVPALDIIFSREYDVSKDSVSKRRKLLGASLTARASTLSSISSFGSERWGVDELKTKKQLLLEKDDWVCTTLARPLVLRHRASNSDEGRSTIVEKAEEPPDPDLSEPFAALDDVHQAGGSRNGIREYNPTGFPSLEKTYVAVGEDGNRRFGGAFRDLSDGGYVQIGGSTQCGVGTTTSQSSDGRVSMTREMSDVSEETMLFDLDGLQGKHRAPFRPTAFITQGTPGDGRDNRSGSQYRIPHPRDDSEDMLYYKAGPRRNGCVADELPSSPLAAYSQNINFQKSSEFSNSFTSQSSEPAEDLIGEIEEAATDTISSSPSTILSTIYLRPDVFSGSRVSLPPSEIENPQESLEHKALSYERFPTRTKHTTLEQDEETLGGLNRLLREEAVGTQNLSLMAYASSPRTSFADYSVEEGENWALGSNISPQPHETPEIGIKVPLQAPDDDWGGFLRSSISHEMRHIEQERTKNDIEKYLDGVGIWEMQLGKGDEALVDDQYDHIEPEKYEDLREHGDHLIEIDDISNNMEGKNSRGLPDAIASELILWPEGESRETPWKNFVTNPLNKSSVQNSSQKKASFTRKPRIVSNHYEEPLGVVNEAIHKPAIPGKAEKAEKAAVEKLAQPLDLSVEEDRAWRMFVFDGLDHVLDEEQSIKAPEHSKPTSTRRSSLKPISQFIESAPLEPQLPIPLQHSNDLDLLSTAGATAGSGSILSLGGTSVMSSSVKSRSKYFNANSSSPLVSPVSLVSARPESSDNKNERKGRKQKPITFWLGKTLGKNITLKGKGAKEEDKREGDKQKECCEVDEIREW